MDERASRPPSEADGDAVCFTFDGRMLVARRGQSIAAALLSNGIRTLHFTRDEGRPRGLFCGIGNCFDCLVDLGPQRAVRACLQPVSEGDQVVTSRSLGRVDAPDGVDIPGGLDVPDIANGADDEARLPSGADGASSDTPDGADIPDGPDVASGADDEACLPSGADGAGSSDES